MFDQQHNPSQNKRQTNSPEREVAIARFWDKYIAIFPGQVALSAFIRGMILPNWICRQSARSWNTSH